MGLDIVILIVLAGLTYRGFSQGFLKGAASVLTPIIGLMLAMRYSKGLASWFPVGSGSGNGLQIAFAVLAILVVTYLLVRLVRYLVEKLFDRLRAWNWDRYLGGALGLVKASALCWVILAFVFIAYPAGRKTIVKAPIATQILLLGQSIPSLKQKMDKANTYITALSNPLKRYDLPTRPDSQDNWLDNLQELKKLSQGSF
jgi:uncharacterized membrane protein required for colicin V production